MKKIDTFQTFARGVKGLVAVMLLMLMAVGGAFAQTTYSHSIEAKTFSSFGTQTLSGVMWTASGSETSYFGYDATKGQQFGSGSSACTTLNLQTSDILGEISSVKVNTSGAKSIEATFKVKVGDTYFLSEGNEQISLTQNATNYTFVGSASGAISLEWTQTSSKAIYVKSIEVIYTTSPAAVAAPTCDPAAGMFYAAREVTLACATEGATIYYSMDDGATPYLLYNDPINITEAVTLKAFAVLDEDTSAVISAEYTFPVDANTIAALKATGIPNTIYKLAEDVIVIYQNGKYLFVQDEDDAVVVFGNVAKTYNPGDVIADGFFGKYQIYNNLNELVPEEGAPAFPAGVAGPAVEPIVATVDTVLNNYATWEAKLVKFENVVFTDATHFAQGEDTLVIYNQFRTSFDITPGSVANVTGLVVKYKSNVQIYPRTNADVEILSTPAAELPYRLNFDEYVDENLVIDNGTCTNKWYVGQAQDFDNNKLYISSSNGRTNKYNTEAASRVIASRDLNIPANGAIVSFDCRYKGASDDHLKFEIRNAVEHSVLKVESTNNEWENVTLSIPSEMAGVVTISFVWENNDNGGEQYPAAIDNIYIYESPCSQPAALSTTVDTTSATITWSGDAEAYLLQYKLANHSEWYSVNTNDTTVTLTNLQGNYSNYDVRVQSVCDEYASAWTEGHFAVDCQHYVSGYDPSRTEYKVVGTETGASTSSYTPFYGLYNYSYSQQIVEANEINAANGPIYSVSFKCSQAPASTSTGGIRIWLGNTDKTSFTDEYDYINPSQMTEVYVGPDSYRYTSGWNEFVFTTPFEYTGGNLVIAYYEGNDDYNTGSFYVNSKSDYKAIYHYSDDIEFVSYESPALASATSYKQKYRNVMKFKVGIPVEVCADPILCPDVTDVVVSDITKEGATIAWTPGSEAQDNFIVEYKAANEVEWTVADSNISTPPYNLTGLDLFTNYIVRVKANCGDYNMSEAAVSNEFRTKGICDTVTEISHYNLATTVVLTWTPGANETAWTVKFKPAGAPENAWVEIPVQGQATASLGGLQAQTAYEVQILALCEGDPMGLSDWATYSFTSACATVDIPVTYALTDGDRDCWEANTFDFSSYYAYTDIPGASLISPSFNIPREGQYFVSFDVEGDYQLLASYRGTRDDRFEVLTSDSDAEGKVIVAIPEEYLGRGVNFKLICTSESILDAHLRVSNFKINTCPFEPTNFVVSDYTANTVSLSWTADTTVNNFQVQYGERGFVLGEGTIIDVLGDSTTIDVEYGNDYSFYVRANCGSNGGDWVGPISQKIEFAYIMGEVESITTCIGTLYDNGGPQGQYESYSNDVMVIYPASENSVVRLQGEYETEQCCDKIYIYDGENTSAHQLGEFGGQGTIDVTSTTGALTVKFTSDGSVQYSGFALNISCEQLPTCGVPTIAVNSSAVATITRNDIGVPDSYDLAIGEDTVINVAGPTVDLTTIFTTLAPNTEYAVSVRANCGEGDYSLWSNPVSFTTPCMALELPYTEDFEGTATTFPSMCWSSYYVSGPGTKNWVSTTDQKHSGSRAAKTQDQSATTIHNLVTPQLNISKASGAILTFWVYRVNDYYSSSNYSQEGIKVLYCDNIEGNNATELKYIHRHITYQPVETAAGWYEYSAIIPQGQYYVIFQGINQYGGSTYIDDISVEEAPTCFAPTDLAVTAADTTAQLTWEDEIEQAGYKVQYRLVGESTWQEVTGITATNYTLRGLQPSSEYEARVLAVCGEGDESEATEISFTTMCLGGYYEGVSIGEGTNTSYYLPTYPLYNYSLTQQIYTAEEMDFTGNLNSVSFYNTSSATSRNLSVYLVHTSKSAFTGVKDWISVSASDKVFEGNVNFVSNDWTTIEFNTPFAYNGTDNLALIVDDNTGDYVSGLLFRTYSAADSRAIYIYSDGINYNPQNPTSYSGTLLSSSNQVLFNGGRVLNCPPTCPKPTALQVANKTANLATITWTAGGSENAWNVEYGKAGFTPGEGTKLAVEEASVELTGLEMGVGYDVYVQANCAADDQSEWAGPAKFVTECEAIATLPYTQDFEGETFEPACWSQNQLSGSELWFPYSGYVIAPYNPGNSVDLITPAFDLSSYESVMLTFDHVQWPYAEIVDKLELYYRTDETADWTLFQEYAEATGDYVEPLVWKNEKITLPSEALTENVQFAFRGIGLDGNNIYLDNVVVMEVPDCYAPTDLTLNDVTTTTAQISWTAGDSVQTAWNVQYGEHNFTLGEGTIVAVDTTMAELTNLTGGTAYDVYVQSVCNESDSSTWAGPIVIATECVTINTLPYTQDFESDFFEPLCWSQEQLSGSYPWNLYSDNTGNLFAGFPYNRNNSANLITPKFNLTSYESVMLSFEHVQMPDAGVVDKLELFYRTSEDADWTLIKEYTEATSDYVDYLVWKNETMILPEEALTDNVQFAFRGTGIYGYNIYLDNVVLMETPCGYIEDLAVAQDSMTDTRAYITWKGIAQEYALEYQEAGDETWTDVPVSAQAQWLTNLTPSTNYNVRVKAVCGEEEAEYSDEISFSTLCLGYLYNCPELHNDLTVDLTSDFRVACEINDPVVVKVTNNAYLDTITSLNLYYVVNDGDTVAETLTLTTPLCFQGETTYTFNEIPVFEEGNNTVNAWVEYNESAFRATPVIASIIEPIDEYPYSIDLFQAARADGWNAYDVNEDGVTMFTSGQGVTYNYNDTLDANDWMITPCFYFEPGKYVISYSYNANSVLKESFEFRYGNGAKVADMTTMLGSEEFSGTAVNTASYDFDVTEAGVYNFGFWATSLAGNLGFNITNFSIKPVNIVTVNTDGNGTTTPSGDVYVNYGENLTLNIVPNVNYHLSAIYVDSVQVVGEDPYASRFVMYTLDSVKESHNVLVEFKLEFHTHKIVSNYNPAYDQTEGGKFVPAATDTTILVDNHTVFFAPKEHYHFNSLTLSEMDEESPVDFTDSVVYDEATGFYAFTFYNLSVPEYFVNAKFRRDTVNIHYDILTGQGYADASPRLIAGDSVFGQYDTWVDYDINHDLDTTITIRPAGDYHIVNVYVNDQPQNVESDEFHYTFSDVTKTQNVDVKFGYQVTTSIRNYDTTYLESDVVRGTIEPATQLVAEGEATVVRGTVQEHFHLYNLFVDGVDMIYQVEFDEDNNYSLTIDSTIANYHIEAVVKIDTFGIHYKVMSGQGYADESDVLVDSADYITWVNYGDDFMMNLAPDRGFSIGNVIVDGIDMYTANNYLFEYVKEHHYVAVSFVPNDYTITTNAYGQGTVSEGMSFTYDPAHPVNYEFTANAAEGYHISAIVINDAEIDLTDVTDTYTQTLDDVDANYVINAIFEINTYNMVSEASLGGTITPEGLQVVNYGTDMTYDIVADEGRYISSITIDGETTEYTQVDNVTNYTQLFTSINADHSVSATFAVKLFTITAEVNAEANHGTIDGENSFSGEFSYGSNETLNFIPEANYQVSDVVVDGQSVGAVTSYEFVNITAEHNVVVSFAPVQYTLTATSNVPACMITPASTTVQAGSDVDYNLTVATGYHLVNVIANGEEVNVVANEFTIENVQEDYEIFANFAPNNVTVTVEQPAHATITPGTMTYAYGATPSYVIVPEAGYDVTAVHAGNALVNVTYNNGIGSFTLNPVTADITLTATTAIKTFTITATQAAHGTISPAPVQTVNYGGNVTYTITPDDYYEIVDVLVDGASRGAISTYTFNYVTANHTIEAVFEAACMTPSRLTVVYVDTNSATLTWEGNAASYEVRYRAAGETNFTTQTVNTNTITLTGLTENTLYAWGVKANCTATLSSDWAESAFRTHAVIPPYVGISTADLSSIKVYSNLNNVYIVNENGIAIDNVTIYNIFGAQVYTGKANNNPEIISLDVANGNYIVRLSTENGVGVYKLSIVR